MAGLSADNGSTANAIPDDLVAIYQGGANFLNRVAALEQRKTAAETALANLAVGTDLVAAKAQSDALGAAAATDRAAAAKILADAQTSATGITTMAQAAQDAAANAVAAANVQAAQIVSDAKGSAAKIISDAKKQAADLVASNTRLQSDLTAQLSAAKIAESSYNSKSAECDSAKQNALAAQQAADALVAKLQSVIGPEKTS